MGKWEPASVMPEMREATQQALLVQIVVARTTGVAFADLLLSGRGSAREAFARQVAMYLCRLVFAMTLGEIALAFQRDRSTAAYAIRRIEEAREQPVFDRQISIIEAALRWHGGVHG